MAAFANEPDPASPLEIVPVAGRIGSEVRGVRLLPDMDEATLAASEAALGRPKCGVPVGVGGPLSVQLSPAPLAVAAA